MYSVYFLLYLVVEFLQLIYETSSFPEVLYKRDVLKNFSKLTDKHNKQPSAGILSRDVLKYFGIFTEKVIFRSFSFNKVVGWKSETVRSSYLRFSVKKTSS